MTESNNDTKPHSRVRASGSHDEVGERRAALEAVRSALRRELYSVAERPELTWQQLHNRLQRTESLAVAVAA